MRDGRDRIEQAIAPRKQQLPQVEPKREWPRGRRGVHQARAERNGCRIEPFAGGYEKGQDYRGLLAEDGQGKQSHGSGTPAEKMTQQRPQSQDREERLGGAAYPRYGLYVHGMRAEQQRRNAGGRQAAREPPRQQVHQQSGPQMRCDRGSVPKHRVEFEQLCC
jgi:hypothetical protein